MAIISDGFFREGMGGAPVSASYLTTAADPTLTAEVVLTATQTELNYVGGVTSALQTQINGKSATGHTHTLANVTDVTASITELNYIDGVTSAIQGQIDGKAATAHTHAEADVTNLTTDLAAKAPLASPTFTGTPAAGTAAPGTNTTQLATTAFVTAAVAAVSGFWEHLTVQGTDTWTETVGTWAVGAADPLMLNGNALENTTNAQNDEIRKANIRVPTTGTYAVRLLTINDANRAIITVALDGTSKGTVDTYSAATAYNTWSDAISLGSLTAGTAYRLDLKAATRNGSSAGWTISLQYAHIYRTA